MKTISIVILIYFSLMGCFTGANSADLRAPFNSTQYIENLSNTFEYGDTDVQEIEKHLKYIVFRTPEDFVIISASTPEKILNIDFFDPSKKTLFYAGGILSVNSSGIIDFYKLTIAPYCSSKNYNYIFLYQAYYCTAMLSPTCTTKVSRVFGPGIDKLVSLGLPAENLAFLGHSIGAHIDASIIENMDMPVKILIGLDPGGVDLVDFRRGLAEFTIALRTDSTNLGNINWNADLELIVNGGISPQPGCLENEKFPSSSICSHVYAGLVWKSIVENQGQGLFYGVLCNEIECDYSDIKEINPDLREKGTYYFKTSDSYPYGLGLDGVKNIVPTQNSSFKVDWELISNIKKNIEDSWRMQDTYSFHID